MKNLIIIIISIVFLIISVGIIGYFFVYKKDDTNKNRPTSIETTYKPNTSANAKQNTSANLKVQGASDTKSSQEASNQLPTPDNFEVYEKYANEQNALYADIVVGKGAEAVAGSTVAMVYSGWLTNGELFDQNRKNEIGQIELFSFKLGGGQVISGWEQTIAGMKEGGKRRLIIPSTAGYGPSGQGPIPPNAMLIFDVELISTQ
jgi:FKBP-type peptidyl-prolyl cis-trans isomerase